MKKEIVEDIELEEVENTEEVIDLKQTRNYVDNERLYKDFVWYISQLNKYEKGKIEEKPRMTNYMGECFMKIAHGYSNHHLFKGYTNAWKEEMIDEAIEACIKYSKSFDPEKYNNPFTYITYICHTAFLKRIKIEKRLQYKKNKYFVHMNGYLAFEDGIEDHSGDNNGEISDQLLSAMEFVETYENSKMFPGNKKKDNKNKGLDEIINEDDNK